MKIIVIFVKNSIEMEFEFFNVLRKIDFGFGRLYGKRVV